MEHAAPREVPSVAPAVREVASSAPALRDVACFALVARRRSFSGAAAELGLSQPAVSQAVARLERVLGVRLLERTSREVRLSTAGRALLPHVDALLDRAEALTAEARRLADPPGIRLAYCPLAGALAGRVARRLGERKPALDVELRPLGWAAATAALASGAVSAAVMSAPYPPGLATTARFHVPITHLAVRAGTPLATAARIGPAQLARQPVLLPRHRPEGSVWAHLAERLDGLARLALADFDAVPDALDLVAAGRGLLPTPQLLVETVRRPDVWFVPLVGFPGLRMAYALVWPAEPATEDTMALVRAVQEALRQ
jgi:DNA-binding transcriptional LysR family regulator